MNFVNWILILGVLALAFTPGLIASAQASTCEYWVAPAPAGNNANPGTSQQPWATLEYAAGQVARSGGGNCTVWLKNGVYDGPNEVQQRFSTTTVFKAVNAYKAILQNSGPALEVKGGANMVFEGLQFQHSSLDASALLVFTERSGSEWAENITFRNNLFHDSYNNDLLKLMDGSRFIVVEGNVFYNQGSGEQHMDVNSVTDVTIQDNIFFNDFAPNNNNTKHFIVIKDSNNNDDGLMGSERVTVRRNIFLNWQGAVEAYVQVGNDGKPFHEAKDIRLENNLMIGNALNKVGAVLGVAGARDVTFVNNTVVGDMPSSAYAFRVVTKDQNPPNRNLLFYNNIWSDPTGTMGADSSGGGNDFSDGDSATTSNLILDNNLYWNGPAAIPSGDLASPLVHDAHRVVGNPQVSTNQASIVLPRWNGTAFLSGSLTIRQEFERLAGLYGRIPPTSPAVNKADPAFAPTEDLLKRPRGTSPDLGAYEADQGTVLTPTPTTPPPTVTATPTQPVSDLVFADDFEAGTLASWSASKTDGTDLRVDPAAALTGVAGMRLNLNDANTIFVTDQTPVAEPRYRVRFRFDPNSLRMASGENFVLFAGYSPASKVNLRLLFGFGNGTYRLRALLSTDAGTWVGSPWIPVSDAQHIIELDWRAATKAGANNGGLTLWVDEQQMADLARVDNDLHRIERVQWGAVAGIDPGTRGVFHLDDFVSRRQTYIGP